MKAISVRQPWAWAILHAGKRIENRDWKGCSYRGPILIHASKGCGREEFDDAVDAILDIVHPAPGGGRLEFLSTLAKMHVPLRGVRHGEGQWRPAPELPFGGIVGRAEVVDVIQVTSSGTPWTSKAHAAELHSPWHTGGFALVLTNVEPLPFVPWKGALGIFDVDQTAFERALVEAQAASTGGSRS